MKKRKVDIEIRNARLGLYLFFVVFFLFAFIFTNSLVQKVYGFYHVKHWAPVNATLLHASIDTRIGSTDSTYKTSHTYYSPNISYEYFVKNNRYIGNKVGWSKTYDTSNMLKKAKEYKYENNQPIVVYVNPDKLSESLAIKNTSFDKVWLTVIVCLVFWSLFLGTGYLLKYKLKYK